MLVLTRKPQESVVVGGSVGFEKMLKVTVLEIVGGKVRLGFDVEKSVPVHRAEVWERLQSKSLQEVIKSAPRSPPLKSNGNHTTLHGIPDRPATEPPHAVEPPRKSGVLVVDDEIAVRRVLNAGMRQEGFAVWLAASGREALDLYKQNRMAIDVVLLDLRMPGMDGTETLAALQEINSEIVCCFMGAALEEYVEWKLCSLGASGVVRKPFYLADVAGLLREFIAGESVRP